MTVLAACLIVKDEAHCIEKCLQGIVPYVDGIFVYDTGSTDGTQEIARKYATVEQGEWRDDFAWARNRNYEMVAEECEWILYADADDTISGLEQIRGLSEGALSFTTAFSFPYRNTWGNLQVDYHTRRLTRRDRYVWRYPLHEQLAPIGEERTVESDAVVWKQVHSLEDRQAHTQRNLDFLLRYAETHPMDDWLASAITLTMVEQGRAREAHAWLRANKYEMSITKSAT